jgi:dihydroorotate dehydrogenase (fumarate)
VDLSADYLGFHLPSPLMPGASPLSGDLDAVRRLEDLGASAIVMHSLFEEQIRPQQHDEHAIDPEQYLKRVGEIRAAVGVPVIASLNGATLGGWVEWAKKIELAGASALELNVYSLAMDPNESSPAIEDRALEILAAVKRSISIPVAVKLSPFISGMAHFGSRLDALGAEGLVMFNRFYQPDIDLESRQVVPRLELSQSGELRLRLRWIAAFYGRVSASLALSGGVHTVGDVVKSIMVGADAVQLVSSLLEQGVEHLATLKKGLERWLETHGHSSLAEIRGSMSLARCPDPSAFERASYVRILESLLD